MRLCLFGASSDQLSAVYFEAVNSLGKEMGRRQIGLVFGGGATGLMGAACKGVKETDGEIIGIAPKFFDREGVLFQNCDEMIFTDTMRERKQRMEDLSDGFVVVPGGIGTLEEFFEIFTLRQLERHRKPIALFNINGYFDKLVELLEHTAREGFMSSQNLSLLGIFDNAGRLLDYLLENSEESHG